MASGDCVGEMSIIEDRDPSAYVIAAEDTHLLVIHRSVLWSMVAGFGSAVGVGLLAGLYPAIRAAWQDPIVALRHD